MSKKNDNPIQKRRDFLRTCGRAALLGGLAIFTGKMAIENKLTAAGRGSCGGIDCESCKKKARCRNARTTTGKTHLWQIDPRKCTQCGRCATHCVLTESAVKCAHSHSMCGYCQLCFGYFQPGTTKLTEAAENQVCPTGAIIRKYIEDPYFEYTVDEDLCIGCGKCVVGCNTFGNGSLHLQVMHDRCVNCNECAIAINCPADAFVRVPIDKPYLFKHELS